MTAATPNRARPLLPLALLLGLIVVGGDQIFAIFDLRRATAELEKVALDQTRQLAQVQKIESQLDALASGTARLADAGNPNARRIVQSLQASGVAINAQAKPIQPQ
jgi:hypothetical protein